MAAYSDFHVIDHRHHRDHCIVIIKYNNKLSTLSKLVLSLVIIFRLSVLNGIVSRSSKFQRNEIAFAISFR